jgi:hypothetical protein
MPALLKAIGLQMGDIKSNVCDKFRKAPAPLITDTPLGLKIGSAIQLETFKFDMNDDYKLLKPDKELFIMAYGLVNLDSVTKCHRFYSKSEAMLQIVTVNSVIDEIILFTPFDSVYPQDEEDLTFWVGDHESDETGLIGQKVFESQDGTNYDRVWVSENEDDIYPVEFEETIVFNHQDKEGSLVEHKAMLFTRNISAGADEFLLVSAEDTGDTGSIELMLGSSLSESDFTVFNTAE